jgi:protein gp37
MGDRSAIEWTNATWNVITGCSKVSSGCKNCYAERLFPRAYPGREFTDVRTHPERLKLPLKWKRLRRIFVNSMSDMFHDAVPDQFIGRCFGVMAEAHWHTFQILTKRPQRMLDWSKGVAHYPRGDRSLNPSMGWPPNAWLGVSVEDQKTADERVPLLLKTPAKIRFVSYEPALGPVDFRHVQLGGEEEIDALTGEYGLHLDWVIAGGESGPRARPSHPDWFRIVRGQCQAAGVAFFFKQWGEWQPWEDAKGLVERFQTARVKRFPDAEPGIGEWADVVRVGKKTAGRLLDGREWSEYPETKHVDKLLWR